MRINPDRSSVIPWEKASPKAQRELLIKKIAIVIIAAANLAALACLCAYATLYLPNYASSFVYSPFVVGMIGALTYLKVPIFNTDLVQKNYKDFKTPAILVTRAVTTLVFAPVILLAKWLDWTPYGDPFEAKRIKIELSQKNSEDVLSKYGPKAHNLVRYGYLSEENGDTLHALYEEAKPHLEAKKFFTDEQSSEDIALTNTSLETSSNEWTILKEKILPSLPTPATPSLDFSKTTTKVRVWARKTFGVYTLA